MTAGGSGAPRHRTPSSATRALLWLLGGVVLLVGVLILTAPELMRVDGGVLAELFGVLGLAAVPGLLLLGLAVRRRRRLERDGAPSAADDRIG